MRNVVPILFTTALFGCEPFALPAVVEPGWVFAQSRSGEPNQYCTFEEGALSCTAQSATKENWYQARRWLVGGEDVIVTPSRAGGLELCSLSGTDCGTVLIEDGWYYHTSAVGDLDQDGRPDLAVGNVANFLTGERYAPYVCWGADAVDKIVCEPQEIEADRDHGVTIEDIDGDGDRDVVFGALNIDTWNEAPAVCRGDGAGGLDCETWALPSEFANGTTTVGAHTADLNGDGELDVIPRMHPQHNPPLYWCEGAAGVTPTERCVETPVHNIEIPQWFADDWFNHAAADLTPTDLDEDGDIDILANTSTGFLYTCANDGQGNFTCEGQHESGAEADGNARVLLGDVDGDGTREVFALGSYSIVWCSIDGTDLDCDSLPVESRLSAITVRPSRVVN